ncbi:M15 family metallopeptidase [Flaviramulus sp. BrNp1-15]|uniref:M15 family metallopeptidase n=1 Tax=Flaviramulus sp. BrNp1-15 TaxID=2916754 RepID=UPI001EE8B9B3|nr:M15 family metallopeptidase [Flaviramulus sp. BrNp1-15]ULC58945.1 M15 family metallopeptidase [Flaviramulus sp. BrNp1-15]
MKFKIIVLFFFICLKSFSQLPNGFVYVKDVIPDLEVELRYNTSNNFLGKRVDGYHANNLILTVQAANALKLVHEALQEQNLCLKVYDGYRPQQAVNHFVTWTRDLNDTINKHAFYPEVRKRYLFKAGYISSKSGHSRGSTVDLTIIDGNTGEALDMGSPYDFFGEESWVSYKNITEEQKANRQLLQKIMSTYGFRNYPKEWWHFTLRGEPFPNTFFDFPIK